MNGIIPIEIRKFIEYRLGPMAWPEVVAAARIPFRVYVPVTDYPDEDVVALLAAFAQRTGETLPALLAALGEFIVPDLLSMVPTLIRPTWKTLDLLANTEQAIHEVMRSAETNTHPPQLACQRVGPNDVVVTYASYRRLCPLARGIIVGVAKHFGEQVSITEPSCMLRGDAECCLHVTVTAP